MSSYISLRTFAQLLGKPDVVGLLNQTLNEEKKAAEKVTEVGDSYVNKQVPQHSAVGAGAC